MGIPTAVAPTTKQINPRTATHVEYNGLVSAISQTQHHSKNFHKITTNNIINNRYGHKNKAHDVQ